MSKPIDIPAATLEYATRLGDDALIFGHRTSEWCSKAPFLEEDLALQNVALDYIGRARMYYGYAAELRGGDTTEDYFAYLRNEREFHNLLICELPRGDFAFTIVRQLLLDVFYILYLAVLCQSQDATLAAIAAKSLKESRYHLRRSRGWCVRLGDATDESHQRMQQAVNDLWGYSHEMFDVDAIEQSLISSAIAVDSAALYPQWKQQVGDILTESSLQVPEDDWVVRGGRTGYHTENLGHILTEMQFLQRTYPHQQW